MEAVRSPRVGRLSCLTRGVACGVLWTEQTDGDAICSPDRFAAPPPLFWGGKNERLDYFTFVTADRFKGGNKTLLCVGKQGALIRNLRGRVGFSMGHRVHELEKSHSHVQNKKGQYKYLLEGVYQARFWPLWGSLRGVLMASSETERVIFGRYVK